MEVARIKHFKHIICFILLLIMQQIPLLLVGSLAALPKAQRTTHLILIVGWLFLILTIGITILMWYLYQKVKGPQYHNHFSKAHWRAILIGFVAMLVINNLTVPFMQKTGNANVDGLVQMFAALGIFMLPYTLILGPMMEELLFRGFLMNWFFVKSPILNIMTSALLFGLVHVSTDPIYFISKALLGLVLAIVYYRTKTIKSSIILHVLNNLSAGLTIF